MTDAITLSEVNTPARANGVIVRLYFDISGTGTRTTQHDLASLSLTYQ